MRETVFNGKKYFVFQDVCMDLFGRVRFKYLLEVSPRNQAIVKLPGTNLMNKKEIVVNAAGIKQLRKVLKEMHAKR